MKIGMLWFDNDPKSDLAAKVTRAAGYYNQKYGKVPNLCFVHPSMLSERPIKAQGIEIKSNRTVLPNHLWLGVRDFG